MPELIMATQTSKERGSGANPFSSFVATPFRVVLLGILCGGAALLLGSALVTSESSQTPQLSLEATTGLIVATVIVGLIAATMFLVGVVWWGAQLALNAREAGRPNTDGTTTDLLRSVNDRLLISDQAKRIAYRQRDRDALRDAIVEDIRQEEYEAALVLVEEMAETFGYREEAEQYRRQIDDAQAQRRQHLINDAIARVDEICATHDWDRATHEANRVSRSYPDVAGVANLHDRISAAREAHKAELERAFLEASEHDDVDRALTLMREMDRYLTPAEAEPYRETARGVIGKKRENLGVQFKMSVSDRDWIAAMNVGEQIISDFPNTKMAQEVRDMRDQLRERAADQRAAGR